MLVNITPPKMHDVSKIILEDLWLFPQAFREEIREVLLSCRWLRKERELAFYGDVDFIPGEEYSDKDAKKAIECAEKVSRLALSLLKASGGE